MTSTIKTYDVIVVGAGFAGMYLLHRLRKMNMTTKVFETGSDVGGTWYWNRYPGARCDVESMQYSYSFDRELEQSWHWTERYATQPEILAYAQQVANRLDLRRDIQFNTRVTSAHYDEQRNLWDIRTENGESASARYFVMASGCLSAPRKPDIKGVDSFAGAWYHTAQWPHEGVDFTGKRVGVIGTGSTSIQMIPQVAKQAKHLYVFQRTANYSLPAQNRPLSAEEEKQFKESYEEIRMKMRTSPSGTLAVMHDQSALSVTEEAREATFEQVWNEGGPSLVQAYNDIMVTPEANEKLASFVRKKIKQIVKDPKTAEALCAKDHPIGTKRICVDINYFETYNRDNVSLVDLKAEPIQEIIPTGVTTSAQHYDLDCLIFATGFDAMTGALLATDIQGRRHLTLREKWSAGPRTYLGLQTVGFPNMFMITGPGSPSVLSNMLVSIEQHVDWIMDCLQYMCNKGYNCIEPEQAAEDNWVQHVNELSHQTLYHHANSWYLGANVPGKPRVFMPYVGGVGAYRQHCAEVARDGYTGFKLTTDPKKALATAAESVA